MTSEQLGIHREQWIQCRKACSAMREVVAGTEHESMINALDEAAQVILLLIQEVQRLRMETSGEGG